MALFRSEILNQDFFRAALQEAEKTRNVEILEITIGDCSSTGLQETLPVHITATVRGRERVFDWSAKISSSSQAAVELSRELKLWEKELYLYRELLPSLELRSNLVHLECPAHPDLVYSVLSSSSSALLMTDLAMAGFCPASSSQEVEVEMLELVVSWLAGLHAHSWAHFNSRLTGEKPPALMLDSVPLAGRKLSSEESLVELVASSQARTRTTPAGWPPSSRPRPTSRCAGKSSEGERGSSARSVTGRPGWRTAWSGETEGR